MILLLVGLHRVVIVLLLRRELIHIAELEETAVAVLALRIVLDALQTTIQQRAAHHVQVAAERVHDVHQVLCVGIVCRLT